MKLDANKIKSLKYLSNNGLYRDHAGEDLIGLLDEIIVDDANIPKKEIKECLKLWKEKTIKNFYSDIQLIEKFEEILNIK